jgi:hypothetical protein
VSFTLVSVSFGFPAGTRCRDEALEPARDIMRRARAESQSFAALAREHCGDVVGPESGGSFGGIQAKQLSAWQRTRCSLCHCHCEISAAVKGCYGFQVFTRQAHPVLQIVTACCIVTGHERSPWLGTLDASASSTYQRGLPAACASGF